MEEGNQTQHLPVFLDLLQNSLLDFVARKVLNFTFRGSLCLVRPDTNDPICVFPN